MIRFARCAAAVWLLASVVVVADASAQSSAKVRIKPAAAVSAAPLSPKDRGQLTRQFVLKWGHYVQRVYDVPVGVWAKRMVPTFVAVDSTNFRKALTRDTLEGALAELNGTGHRLADARVIDTYARQARGTSAKAVAQKLGDATGDLVYTPIQPCRIVDTRLTPEGAIASDAARQFIAIDTSYTGQGGSNTDCGSNGTSFVGAVALSVTAVQPTAAGFATVYPFNTTRPLAANVNYTPGAIVNNFVVTKIPHPLSSHEFYIYTFAQSHYVVDIVGYFSAPQATAQQCIDTPVSGELIPANTSTFRLAPTCPTGYQATIPYCWAGGAPGVYNTGSGLDSNSPSGRVFCAWHNTTGVAQQVQAGAVCCRVPGR
jgi:hypothetical protein